MKSTNEVCYQEWPFFNLHGGDSQYETDAEVSAGLAMQLQSQ